MVLVGEDPASQAYVASKGRAALACGFHSVQHSLPAETSEGTLLALIDRLNADPAIHGVLVQLPLPKAISATRAVERVAPHKDVDGLHPVNAGLHRHRRDRAGAHSLHAGGRDDPDRPRLRGAGRGLEGKEAVVVGRSNLVGKPMAQLLLRATAR